MSEGSVEWTESVNERGLERDELDWEAKTAAFLSTIPEEEGLSVEHEEEGDDDTPYRLPDETTSQDIDSYIGIPWRQYDLRQGINRQPLLAYDDHDDSGTFQRRNSPDSDRGSTRRRNRGSANSQKKVSAEAIDNANGAAEDPNADGSVVEKRSGLRHPVMFFVDRRACHWCHDAAYGLIAPRATTLISVRILDEETSLQWTPIPNKKKRQEHRDDSSSQMCIEHAQQRLKKALCKSHQLTRIHPQGKAVEINFKDEAEQLQNALRRLQNRNLRPTDIFCDFCLNLASWHCDPNAPCKHHTTSPAPQAAPQGNGCGLCLCNLCMIVMQDNAKKLPCTVCPVQHHLRWLFSTLDNKYYPLGPRPDAELLLLNEGLLIKNYRAALLRCKKS